MFPDLDFGSMSDFDGMQETISRLRNRDRIEVLALVRNRVLKMSMTEPYAGSPIATEALTDLNSFLKCVLDNELIHLGDSVQSSYLDVLPQKDLKTVSEVETEYCHSHTPRGPEPTKTDA